MAIALPSELGILYSTEGTWAETPSTPTLTPIRFLGTDLGIAKETRRDNRIKANAQRGASYYTGHASPGTINALLVRGEYDDFIAAALRTTAVTIDVTTSSDTDFASSGPTITSTGTDFAAAGVVAGMYIQTSGSAESANNTYWKVASVSTNTITVEDGDGVMVDTTGETITVTAKMFRSGTTNSSFFVEHQWTNITEFNGFVGCRVNTLEIGITALELATLTIGLSGKEPLDTAASTNGDGSPNAYSTNPPVASGYTAASISGFDGWWKKNSTAGINGVNNWTLSIDNGITLPRVVSQRGPYEINPHWHTVTANLGIFYEDSTYLDHILAHDELSWTSKLTDPDGNPIFITVFRAWFTNGFPEPGGAEEDTLLTLPMEAGESTTYSGVTVQIDMP